MKPENKLTVFFEAEAREKALATLREGTSGKELVRLPAPTSTSPENVEYDGDIRIIREYRSGGPRSSGWLYRAEVGYLEAE